ncbi:MAG: DUF1788 domain-containing protein [Spirochaetia bacterium]|nr:DUF1788 domain-containing protein [Spirochaetia bacterium]
MSRVRDLVKAYDEFISLPWQEEIAASQRVIMCIYDEQDELKLRAIKDEFGIVTTHAGHQWLEYDLTDAFPRWLMANPHAQKSFARPNLFNSLLHTFKTHVVEDFTSFIDKHAPGINHVVALTGIGSLFGYLKVKDLLDAIAPMVKGRLVVFFPGSYEHNNYRLLDAYDGWNYLAVPITADNKE